MNVYLAGTQGYGSFGHDANHAILTARVSRVLGGAALSAEPTGASAPFSPEFHDAVIIGGSGILYPHLYSCGTDNLRHWLRYPAAMRWFDKPAYGLALGVQGRLRTTDLEPYQEALDSLGLLTIRDRDSIRKLRDAGVRRPIHECADLSYLTLPTTRSRTTNRSKPVLGVLASQPEAGVIYDRDPHFESTTIEAVQTLSEHFDIHLITFHEPTDGWLGAALDHGGPCTHYHPPDAERRSAVVSAIANADILLTSRFHGLVLAALHAVPVVALGAAGEKLESEAAALKIPYFVTYGSGAGRIVSSVQECWSQRTPLRETLSRRAQERRSLSERTFDLFECTAATGRSDLPSSYLSSSIQAERKTGSTLVVWAASDELWEESAHALQGIGTFDALLPQDSRIQHPAIGRRIVLPRPGLMNWRAFQPDLRHTLAGAYDAVIVASASRDGRQPLDLVEIASESGRRQWEFNVWTQRIRFMRQPEAVALSA